MDETSVPCRDGGGAETDGAKGVAGRGRGADGRILLAGAVDLSEDGAPRRIRLGTIGDYGSGALRGFISGAVAPGARVVTDGWSGCAGLPEIPREERVVGGRRAHEVLTRVHRAFSSLKRRAMGVHHGLRRRHVQRCLDDFVFRWNRRRHRRTSLDSLLGIGPGLPPATCHDIVGGRAWRGRIPRPDSATAPAGAHAHPRTTRIPAFRHRPGRRAAPPRGFRRGSGDRPQAQHLAVP